MMKGTFCSETSPRATSRWIPAAWTGPAAAMNPASRAAIWILQFPTLSPLPWRASSGVKPARPLLSKTLVGPVPDIVEQVLLRIGELPRGLFARLAFIVAMQRALDHDIIFVTGGEVVIEPLGVADEFIGAHGRHHGRHRDMLDIA